MLAPRSCWNPCHADRSLPVDMVLRSIDPSVTFWGRSPTVVQRRQRTMGLDVVEVNPSLQTNVRAHTQGKTVGHSLGHWWHQFIPSTQLMRSWVDHHQWCSKQPTGVCLVTRWYSRFSMFLCLLPAGSPPIVSSAEDILREYFSLARAFDANSVTSVSQRVTLMWQLVWTGVC